MLCAFQAKLAGFAARREDGARAPEWTAAVPATVDFGARPEAPASFSATASTSQPADLFGIAGAAQDAGPRPVRRPGTARRAMPIMCALAKAGARRYALFRLVGIAGEDELDHNVNLNVGLADVINNFTKNEFAPRSFVQSYITGKDRRGLRRLGLFQLLAAAQTIGNAKIFRSKGATSYYRG